MKRVMKITAVLAAVAMLILLPDANAFTAKAAEPGTYAVKFDLSQREWRMQANTSTFDDNVASRSTYTLLQSIKDGDVVVVYNDVSTSVALDLSSVHLSNLTLTQNTEFCIIKTGGIDECHVQSGNYASIHGDVKNAYVYDTTTCTFNNNVDTLTVYATAWDGPASNVSVGGTVEHLYVIPSDKDVPRTYHDLYRFNKGTLYLKEGALQTPEWNYLTYDQYIVQVGTETQNNRPAASPSSDEYDDVPKTGQDSPYIWLLGAAALFFAGSCVLRRTNR